MLFASLEFLFAFLPGVLAGFVMPIGISFFTFQALSYVIDVYRGGTFVPVTLEEGTYILRFDDVECAGGEEVSAEGVQF